MRVDTSFSLALLFVVYFVSCNSINVVPHTLHLVWINTSWPINMSTPNNVLSRAREWHVLNPRWRVRIWTNENVAAEFPKEFSVLRQVSTAAWVSDILRYGILSRHGGLYVDTDVVPLKPIPERFLGSDFSVCERPRDGGNCTYVCNAVIGAVPGSPLLRQVFHKAFIRTKTALKDNPSAVYPVTGPVFWTEFALAATITILPARTFFPCRWSDKSECVASRYKSDGSVIAMHEWAHSWRLPEAS
eukprot:m.75827 g.75827  ORF g.75827 m.75827 type:complete len:245 (-) comp10453_c0_seq1:131-865(-)